MDFGNLATNLLGQMAFFHLTPGNYMMIGVALVFLYLGVRTAAADSNCIWYAACKHLSGDHVFTGRIF